jgi:formylglycine-generating enzyme required for sulfatase activity
MPRRFASWLGLLIAFAGLATAQDGPQPASERVFVLIVGIEDYSDPKITDLAYTEDDAQGVYDFFAKSPRSPTIASRVKLLRGKNATRVAVLSAIRDLLTQQATKQGDTALFYFAGHGFSDADGVYLATSDTQLSALPYTSIAWSDLQREWNKIMAGRRVLLADACHAGGLKGLRGFGGITKGHMTLKKAPSRASVLIGATGANQLSVEDKKRKHGVFTASLLDGLAGAADANRDGAVSLGELAAHLKSHVPRLARQAGGNQIPVVSIRGSEAFAQSLVLSAGVARPKPATTGELARVKAERLAAEREREGADLRTKVAEARLEKLKGASAEERRKAQTELTQARAQAAKAGQAVARLRAEESKRIAAEKRAAKAEAENAELRQQLAELQGHMAEAAKAKREAEAARKRERELANKSPAGSGPPDLSGVWVGTSENGAGLTLKLARDPGEGPRPALKTRGGEWRYVGSLRYRSKRWACRLKQGSRGHGEGTLEGLNQRFGLRRERAGGWVLLLGFDTIRMKHVRGPQPVDTSKSKAHSSAYARALERAKRLKGLSYLDTKTFASGGKSFKIARFTHAETQLVFHLVPGGSYMRGTSKGNANEKPVAEVTIQPFLICATECTQAAWKKVVGTSVADQRNKSNPKWPLRGTGPRHPIYYVSWTESKSFCKQTQLRLPSEAEWEYACRAGSTGAYAGGEGEKVLLGMGWFFRNSGRQLLAKGTKWDSSKILGSWGCGARPVGEKLPNAFGLYDVHGNVWEWCEDVYVKTYSGAPTDGSAHIAGASERTCRGGGWDYEAWQCRSAVRSRCAPSSRTYYVGFRPARSLP